MKVTPQDPKFNPARDEQLIVLCCILLFSGGQMKQCWSGLWKWFVTGYCNYLNLFYGFQHNS